MRVPLHTSPKSRLAQRGTRGWLDNASAVGSLLCALIGYNAQPSWLELATYIGYWLSVWQVIHFLTRRLGTRAMPRNI